MVSVMMFASCYTDGWIVMDRRRSCFDGGGILPAALLKRTFCLRILKLALGTFSRYASKISVLDIHLDLSSPPTHKKNQDRSLIQSSNSIQHHTQDPQ